MSVYLAGTRVEVARSFRDLPPGAGKDLRRWSPEIEHSQAYLEYLEDIDPSNRLYFTVFHHGLAVATSQAVLTSDLTLPLSRPAEMLAPHEQAAYERLLYPSIVVRNLWDCLPLVRPDEDGPAQWWPLLFSSIEKEAQRLGARSVTCLNAPAPSSGFGSFLVSRGYLPARYCAIAEIGVRGIMSFEQYLHRFTGDTRRGIRRERRRFKEAGLTVRRLDPDHFLQLVVEQETSNWEKHGEAVDPRRLYRLRHSLVSHLGARARLLGAVGADGRVVASGIHLLGRAVYHAFTFGADYGCDQAASYPELTFYTAVESALKSRCLTVNLGYEAYQGKVFRGATLRDMYAYVLPSGPPGRRFAESLLPEVSKATGAHLASVVRPRLKPSSP